MAAAFMDPPADLGTDVYIVRLDDTGDDKFAAIAKGMVQRIAQLGEDQHATTTGMRIGSFVEMPCKARRTKY